MGDEASGRRVGGHRTVRAHADHREAGAGGSAHDGLPRAHERHHAHRRHAEPFREQLSGFPDWDPAMVSTVARWVRPFRDKYFRSEISGLDNIPDEPSMVVGNHDGGYVFPDAICLGGFYYDHF